MKRSPSRISKSSFLGIDNFPLCNVPIPGVEVHPYFKQRPRVRSIGSRVLFFLYLDQRLVGASVQLELKNVNEVLGFHNAVGSPPAGMHFSSLQPFLFLENHCPETKFTMEPLIKEALIK